MPTVLGISNRSHLRPVSQTLVQFCVWVIVVKARPYVLGSTSAPIACPYLFVSLCLHSFPFPLYQSAGLCSHTSTLPAAASSHRRPFLCLLWGLESQQEHSSGLGPSQFSTFLPSSGASFSSPVPIPRFSLLTEPGSHIASCLPPCSGSQLRPVGGLKKTLCVLAFLALHLPPHTAARGTWNYFLLRVCVCAPTMGCIWSSEGNLCRQVPPSVR